MRHQYELEISGIHVIFDMDTYSETNRITDNVSQLIDIHNNDDYKLLHAFKMAKFAHDHDLPSGDPVSDMYKEKYQELLLKVTERFPD